MKNPRLVSVFVLLWLAAYAGLVHAASLTQDLATFDYVSLLVAGAAGLLGALLRTILTLAQEKYLVIDVLKQARRDFVIGFIGGLMTYGVIQGLSSWGIVTVPRDMRILIIVAAGFSRGAWLPVMKGGAQDLVDAGRAKLRMGAPPSADDAPSVVALLEPKT